MFLVVTEPTLKRRYSTTFAFPLAACYGRRVAQGMHLSWHAWACIRIRQQFHSAFQVLEGDKDKWEQMGSTAAAKLDKHSLAACLTCSGQEISDITDPATQYNIPFSPQRPISLMGSLIERALSGTLR
jgi:hypothetical protein